eukprot:1516360-Pyramimonas_sp.AAC.1
MNQSQRPILPSDLRQLLVREGIGAVVARPHARGHGLSPRQWDDVELRQVHDLRVQVWRGSCPSGIRDPDDQHPPM